MTNATCAEYRDRVEDVLDRLLPPEESERLDAHREACAECAARWTAARRFRDLLAREGRAALGAWEARRLSVHAATMDVTRAAAAPGAPAPARRRRFTVLRLAAAAAVVAAAGLVGTGMLGDSGPVVLAAGAQTRLDPGSQATFGHGSRLVVEDRAVTLTLLEDTSRDGTSDDLLQMHRGVALFRVHPEHPLGVATPQGVARAVGATFVVDVRSDGAVVVDVVTGRVRVVRDRGDVVARPGERVEIDSGGTVHVVSRARLDGLAMTNDRRSEEISNLRTELRRADEQLDAYAAAAQAGGSEAPATDGLPYLELGRVTRILTDRAIPWRDPRRNEAMAFFLLNAERIRQEFGASDPMRAVERPAFVAAVAEGYLRALEPTASDEEIAATVDEIRTACGLVEADMAGELVPTELSASRQRALTTMIRAVERHLGSAAAAELVRSIRGAWDGPRPWVQALDDRLEAKLVGSWQRLLDLDEEQANRVAALVKEYVAQSVTMQARVAAALPEGEVESVVFPRSMWGRDGGSRRHRGGTRSSASSGAGEEAGAAAEEPAETAAPPEPSDSEVVAQRLREIDARLRLGEPRARFERALWNMLRPEQRTSAFRGRSRLFTFRERSAPSSSD